MKDGVYLIIDENNSRCGITDRLKTAVGLCYIARRNGLDFYFIHKAGFDLREYLAPSRINWSAELSDISADPKDKQEIRYLAPYSDFPAFRKGTQYICREYIGNNLIEKWEIPNWQQVWRNLFWDMFTPAEAVRQRLDFEKCIQNITIDELRETEKCLLRTEYITEDMGKSLLNDCHFLFTSSYIG